LRRPDGSPYSLFASPDAFRREILLRSTEVLWDVDPAKTVREQLITASLREGWVGPTLPYSHTVDVRSDEVYLQFDETLVQVEGVAIDGTLQWRFDREKHAFYVLERDSDGELFAGALITLGARDEQLYALVASPTSNCIQVRLVRLETRHLKAIRKLRIELSS
jgi:hypothetical protein